MRRPWVVPLAIAVALALHQDGWNWKNGAVLLGLLPVGLAYHVGYSVAASLFLAWMLRVAWPGHLEEDAEAEQRTARDGEGGR